MRSTCARVATALTISAELGASTLPEGTTTPPLEGRASEDVTVTLLIFAHQNTRLIAAACRGSHNEEGPRSAVNLPSRKPLETRRNGGRGRIVMSSQPG